MHIAKKYMIDGAIYECNGRNFTYGIWNKEKDGFEYIRNKFGMTFYFQDIEHHYDDGAPYGTAKPFNLLFK